MARGVTCAGTASGPPPPCTDRSACTCSRSGNSSSRPITRGPSILARNAPLEDVGAIQYRGARVGEQALAGALRFFARASLAGEPHAAAVLRRFLEAAILTAIATGRLLERERFTCALFNHGVYVPQGVIGEACRGAGVRVVNWTQAYRRHCFIFSHGDTYHCTLLTEPVETWEDIPWTEAMEAELMRYLRSRWFGTEDWIYVHDKPRVEFEWIRAHVGADFTRPCVGLLTNVMWDARVFYPDRIFKSMRDWVIATISYFAERSDLQLVIRVHPGEIHGVMPSRQPVEAEIRRAFPALPANVFIVGADSSVSTYALLEHCNAALIYATKAGVELTSMGIPTIVAGEAWIRHKGITRDPPTADAYLRLLGQLPFPRLDTATVQRARKYAYHFFFRRMIPIDLIAPNEDAGAAVLRIQEFAELQPGRHRGLDIVCEGILTGTPFVYPAEDTHVRPHTAPQTGC